MYYIAYGSNLDGSIMKKRCPHSRLIGTSLFLGYRLEFRGTYDGFGYLTVERDYSRYFNAAIYKITPGDEELLDRAEGYPTLYKKVYKKIEINGKEENALMYVMNDNYDYHLPSDYYLKTVEKGYRRFGFDVDNLYTSYLDVIEKIENKGRRK